MTTRELRRVVTEFRDDILDGRASESMCFMVCAPLQSFLSVYGIETRLVEADFKATHHRPTNHVWLEQVDGTIIDPTADQFSSPTFRFPKVYIGKLPQQYEGWLTSSSRRALRKDLA